MFGCLRRLGCLVVLAIAVAAWFTRDMWWDRAAARWRGGDATTADRGTPTWERLSPEAAERGERAVRALSGKRGPVYATLRPGDLASYVFLSLASTLPPSAKDAEAAVFGDRVYVRALVSLKDLGGVAGGALGGMLADRDTLRLGGTFEVTRPGLAQFHVKEVQLGSFPLPARTIPALVRRVRRGDVAPGEPLAADALAVPIPEYIGDVRIARGRITLYKSQQ